MAQPSTQITTVRKIGDGIAILTLNREKAKNAFSRRLFLETAAQLERLGKDSDILCVILTGAGAFFSSGADTRDEELMNDMDTHANKGASSVLMRAILFFPKILVAAVNGPAIGIAATLLPHCDIAIACESAYIWTPFVRLALAPEFASSVTFPHIMGPSMANEMLLGQRKLSAEEALKSHLVSRVLPPTNFLEQVVSIVKEFTTAFAASESLSLFKQMIRPKEQLEALDKVIAAEFDVLDRRLRSGTAAEAAMRLTQERLARKSKL